MIEYDELYKIVESKLSTKRFLHTLRVVERAVEYAEFYHLDVTEVKLTALAHDIAKEFSLEEAKPYYDFLDKTEKMNPSLWHSKIGSILCKQYQFSPDMLAAIQYHTTGRENMSLLEKIIYLADSTESGRKMEKNYSELVKRNIDQAVLEICSWNLKKLLNQNCIIHENSIHCYNYYNYSLNQKF